MRGRGQAARALVAVPVWIATALLSSALFALAGVATLEWRLAREPLPLPWLAQWAEARVNQGAGAATVRIGAASVRSAAWREGPEAPLALTLADAAATEPGGRVILAATAASSTVAMAPLLGGQIRPRTIEAEDIRVRLRRRADGGIGLDAVGLYTQAGGDTDYRQVLQALAGSPSSGGGLASLAGIERVAIHAVAVSVADDVLGATWLVSSGMLGFSRQPGGGVDGAGDLAVALGGEAAQLDLTAGVDPGAATTHARLRVHPVNPAVWGGNVPKLAALAMLNAPVSAEVSGEFGADLALRRVGGEATIAEGRTRINDADVAVLRGSLRADGTPDHITLNQAELVVRGQPESAPSTLTLRGAVLKAAPGYVASGGLDLDRVAFADLGRLWPKAAGTNARRWVTTNMTDGIARDAHVDFTLTSPADFSDVQLTGAAG
ncbi:MAG: hypothetical protein JOZ42_10580, partial [Acetobacteraceae bacterium]|nr:hypothetical protein [Acetobacteraceae bacterium]